VTYSREIGRPVFGAAPALAAGLAPAMAGARNVSVLYDFNGADGGLPYGGVIFDKSGNLYGTTEQGGSAAVSNRPSSCIFASAA